MPKDIKKPKAASKDTPIKAASSEAPPHSIGTPISPYKEPPSTTSAALLRLEKLKELQKQREASKIENQEFLALKQKEISSAPKPISDLKLKKMEKLQKKLENQDVQDDVIERNDNLAYTIRDVERWNEKLMEKEEKKDQGFTDFTQKAAKKYKSTMNDFKPNLTEYKRQRDALPEDQFYRDAHSLAFGTETASARGIERLAQEMDSQQKKRGQFSRRRAYDDEADVTFINERNMRFNKKISRAYDKYTEDIKQSFERGTAL